MIKNQCENKGNFLNRDMRKNYDRQMVNSFSKLNIEGVGGELTPSEVHSPIQKGLLTQGLNKII